jgi:tetratricopeptide (TPR) repeat protein
MVSNSERTFAWGLCILGLACVGWLGCVRRTVQTDPNKADPSGYTKVDLRELSTAPQDFLHRKVCFNACFAGKTNLYQPFRTQFTDTDYVNFTVWPSEARLWLREEMDASLPYMYVARDAGGIIEKNPEQLLEKLDGFKRYQPLVIYGTVASDYNQTAWIAVEAFRPVKRAAYTADAIRRLQLATERYDQKLFDLAAKDFAAALVLGVPPEVEGGVRRSLGLSRLAIGDYAGAVEELATARRLGAADADTFLGQAEAQIELGRFADAEKNARAALTADPRSVLGRTHLAIALGEQGKTAAGLDECLDALKLAPGDADALRAQGIVLDLAGKDKLDAAIESYRQAVLARATDTRIQRELGQLYMKKGDFTKAKEYFENVVNLSKGNRLAYCSGCCLLAQAFEGLKKPEEAVNCYLLAQKRDESHIPAYLGLGSLYAAGGKEKEAIEQYMVVAQKLDPRGENGFQAWRRSAELYRTKPENMAKAAECYEKAAKIKPSDCSTWLDLASARWEQPKPDRVAVEAALRQAVVASPKEHAPHYRLGVVLTELSNTPGAASEFEIAKQLNPKDVATLLRLGQTYRRLCRDAEALKEFEAAAAVDPANPDVKNSLAYVLADIERSDLGRAEKLAAEAVAAKPAEAAYLDTLGWVQVRLNKVKDATANLEKAANTSSDPDVLYHLGSAYLAGGQHGRAIDALTKAEVRLRQEQLACPSFKRLQQAVLKLLAQAKEGQARAAAASAPPKQPAAPKKAADAPKPPATK